MRILSSRFVCATVTLSALTSAACSSDDSSGSRVIYVPNNPTAVSPNPTVPAPQPTQPQPTQPAPVNPQPIDPVTPLPTTTTPDPTGTPTVNPTPDPTAVTPNPVTPTTPVTPEPTPTAEPATSTCAGTGEAVVPQTATGWFPNTSNKSCLQGSWYCFNDPVKTTTCVQDEPPWSETDSAMCITGTTEMRTDPDDYSAWGAGIGVSLNDQSGTKKAFDAEEAGITGFKFTITGALDGAPLLFLIPRTTASDESGPPEFAAKVGANTVKFTDVVQPEWAGTKGPDPRKLYELKWQIKGGDTTSSYNFCVTDLEPIYN